MAVWNKPVSWSKFKQALTCPRQLQYSLEKTPASSIQRGWYSGLGTAVQNVFELFYNQGLWQHERTRTPEVFKEIARRVLVANKFDEGIIYDEHLSKEMLQKEVYDQVDSGCKILGRAGLLSVQMISERGWGATVRNLRLYGKIDFIKKNEDGSLSLYDGKGTQRKNADPNQLVYYAIILTNSGFVVKDAGLIYWKYDLEMVDVSLEAQHRFLTTEFAKGSPTFQQLKSGVVELPATPEREHCGWCSWKTSCDASPFHQKDYQPEGFVTLGE